MKDQTQSVSSETRDTVSTDSVLAEVRQLRQLLEAKAERPYTDVNGYAKRLGMSPRSVRTWLTLGLPHMYCGRSVRIPVQAADAWLAARGKQTSARKAEPK